MYRQSAFGRVPPRRQEEISLPENYSGSAFREEAVDEVQSVDEASVPPENEIKAEEKSTAGHQSFLSGITDKLSGDSLLLLLIMFIVLGGGGEKDDGTLLSLLVLLLI